MYFFRTEMKSPIDNTCRGFSNVNMIAPKDQADYDRIVYEIITELENGSY
jgi:hypothetical protein